MRNEIRKRLLASTILAAVAILVPAASVVAADAIITLDYRSDRLERIDEAPTLSIYADGWVEMPQVYQYTQPYESQLTGAELVQLLGFIVDENRFFEYGTSRSAARSITTDPDRYIRFAHDTTTIFYVQDGDQNRRIAITGLQTAPNTAETDGLRAIRDRLEQMMSVIKLGGTAGANRWLETANEELQAVYPDAEPMKLTNLSTGTQRSDGSIFVQFVREDQSGSDPTRVTISVNASGEYAAAVRPRPE